MSVSGYKVHTSQLAVLGGKLLPGPSGSSIMLPLTPTSAADQHFWSRTSSACLNKVSSLPELP